MPPQVAAPMVQLPLALQVPAMPPQLAPAATHRPSPFTQPPALHTPAVRKAKPVAVRSTQHSFPNPWGD